MRGRRRVRRAVAVCLVAVGVAHHCRMIVPHGHRDRRCLRGYRGHVHVTAMHGRRVRRNNGKPGRQQGGHDATHEGGQDH